MPRRRRPTRSAAMASRPMCPLNPACAASSMRRGSGSDASTSGSLTPEPGTRAIRSPTMRCLRECGNCTRCRRYGRLGHYFPSGSKMGPVIFVAVVSSNALTTNPVSMAYAMTKHAQLAAVEWLAMTYGDKGIRTTAFCPKGMRTPLLEQHAKTNAYARTALADAVTAEQAAATLIEAVQKDRTIAHTHPAVLDDARMRLDDHAEYVRSLQALHALVPDIGLPR